MNTAIVMLGSNFESNKNIQSVKEKINEYFEIVDESKVILTKPAGEKYTKDFLNQSIKILTDNNYQETNTQFKQIEFELGRTEERRQKAEVPIDIDIIFWNGTQKHSDYDRFDFVKQCIDEIKDRIEFSEM